MTERSSTNGRMPSDWSVVFKEWEASGLTQEQYCRDRGLSLHVFRANRYAKPRRRRQPRTTTAVSPKSKRGGFVPVRIVPAHGEGMARWGTSGADESAVIEIALVGGRLIRVLPGFDAATLARVLGVLERSTC